MFANSCSGWFRIRSTAGVWVGSFRRSGIFNRYLLLDKKIEGDPTLNYETQRRKQQVIHLKRKAAQLRVANHRSCSSGLKPRMAVSDGRERFIANIRIDITTSSRTCSRKEIASLTSGDSSTKRRRQPPTTATRLAECQTVAENALG